jgi:hypothetical protein
MSVRGPLQRSNSRDEALAAIAEALSLVGQPDEKLAPFGELEKLSQSKMQGATGSCRQAWWAYLR